MEGKAESEQLKPFQKDNHIAYIRKISADKQSFEYLVTQHLRMSGIYWGLTASYMLGVDLKQEASYEGMTLWILQCHDKTNGG